jgi:hypothetical protein
MTLPLTETVFRNFAGGVPLSAASAKRLVRASRSRRGIPSCTPDFVAETGNWMGTFQRVGDYEVPRRDATRTRTRNLASRRRSCRPEVNQPVDARFRDRHSA